MRTVVVYKWEKPAAGEDDHAAIAVARQVAGDDDLAGLTLGGGDASWALARGVPRGVRVEAAPAGQAATAAVLAAAIRAGGADVVVIGDAEGSGLVPAAIAGHLGIPALLGVTDATVVDGRLRVRRGDEALDVDGPVVLAVSASGPEAKAPGMKEMLAARKRPVEALTVAHPASTAALDETGTRPPGSGAARIFQGEPATAARQLVAALRSEGVL
jgi:electron transfer flavoprotein beta subunit